MEENQVNVGGTILTLQAVKKGPLEQLILQIGGTKVIENPKQLLAMKGSDQTKAMAAFDRMLTYCCGWGVVDSPPDEATELLQALGLATDGEHVTRANWIRYELAEGYDDLLPVFTGVMTLTLAQKKEEPGNGTSEKDEEIAALKAELARLKKPDEDEQ